MYIAQHMSAVHIKFKHRAQVLLMQTADYVAVADS